MEQNQILSQVTAIIDNQTVSITELNCCGQLLNNDTKNWISISEQFTDEFSMMTMHISSKRRHLDLKNLLNENLLKTSEY